MAILARAQDETRHELLSVHLVGRSATCQLVLDNRLVSTSHAQLRWIGTSWEIHDLDSRNGTFVDGTQLDKGERLLIEAGAQIAFGDPDDRFELIDDAPPIAHAVSKSGQRTSIGEQFLVLPHPQRPEMTIFRDRGKWIAEHASNGARQPVSEGEIVATTDHTWTLHLPIVVEETLRRDASPPGLSDMALHFAVSRNQEHIELTLVHPGGQIELTPRVHMELLLRLAEARLADEEKDEISPAERGWLYVSEILRRLGRADDATGRNLLCQHIHQARAQLASAQIEGAVDIVQRRNTVAIDRERRAGQIRIGVKNITIEPE